MRIAGLVCLAFVFSVYLSTPSVAQDEDDEITTKSEMKQAEHYYKRLLYPEALKLYLQIVKQEPKNAKINFRIGVCYLKTAEKNKALEYLQKAATLGEKNEDMVDMNYCFGRAYHFLHEFDKAISYYKTYLSGIDQDRDIQEVTEIKHLIEMCENGKHLIADPVKVKIEHLDGDINSCYPDFSPVVSADGNTLYFSSRRHIASSGSYNKDTDEYNEDVYTSYYKNGKWIPAFAMTAVNDIHDEAPVSLSWDGKDLFIYRTDRGYDYDLFEYKMKDTAHTAPVKMKKTINTGDLETGCSLTPDGNRFYFCSDRKGGFGGMDIYYTEKQADGSWGHAVNMGPIVNTKYDEEAPFIFADGRTLFFSSEGHNSMGESDLFVTKFIDSAWVKPRNLGYPVNTAEDELSITLTADGKIGYYSSLRMDSYGEEDIYKLSFDVFPGIDESSQRPAIAQATLHSDSMRMVYAASPHTHMPIKGDVLEDKAHFEFNASYITEYSRHKIDHVIATLKKYPDMKILVCGYASAMGTPDYNLKLSYKRAETVIEYMVSQGINKERLFAKAYGSENLVISSRDKRQNVLNRRVEFVVMNNNNNVAVDQSDNKKTGE